MTAPVRVMIIGNSVPLLAVPGRPHRNEGTYAERLEALLDDAGVPAQVTNQARLFELIHEGGPRYRSQLVSAAPDVLVIQYGILELQPNVVPTTVVRHLTRDERSRRGPYGAWMRHGLRVVWPHVRRYQRWASSRAGLRTWRLPPKRYIAELNHLVEITRAAHALVIVVDVHRPNARLEHFLPGIGRRWEIFQDELRRAVASHDDADVRVVEASKVVDDLGDGEGTVDGLHMTPAAHGRVAELIADEVRDWVGGRS